MAYAQTLRNAIPTCGVYSIENLVTGERYIGSSVRLPKRLSEHRCKLRKGNHENSRLRAAAEKHGAAVFQFSVLEAVEGGLPTLLQREQHWMDTLRPEYNLAPFAINNGGFKHSPETIARMRVLQKGKTHTPETRALISESLRGRSQDPVAAARSAATRKGMKQTEDWIEKRTEKLRGRKRSPESRQRMSQAAKNRKYQEPRSKSWCQAISEGRKAGKARRSAEKGVRHGILTNAS